MALVERRQISLWTLRWAPAVFAEERNDDIGSAVVLVGKSLWDISATDIV